MYITYFVLGLQTSLIKINVLSFLFFLFFGGGGGGGGLRFNSSIKIPFLAKLMRNKRL